ncbi:MAG: hypothetical protein JWM53_1563 [bacterium]|nr:hypothetical protein [bacterium]
MRIAQAFRAIAVAAFLSVNIGCGTEAVRRTAPKAEEHFARQYFRVLADSGVEAALSLTQSTTRAIPELPESLRALRAVLQQIPHDSLELRRWKVSVETGSPSATKMTYLVRGVEGRFLVGLWIEKEGGKLVAGTVFYGQEPSTGHLRGDS